MAGGGRGECFPSFFRPSCGGVSSRFESRSTTRRLCRRQVGCTQRVGMILIPLFDRLCDVQRLEQADGLARGRLDVQRPDVFPALLEQRETRKAMLR